MNGRPHKGGALTERWPRRVLCAGARFRQWFRCGLAVAVAVVATLRPSAAQGVHVAILPTGETVTPGAAFTLTLEVTEPGSLFNAFEAVVTFDPGALTFVPTSPTSLQQGPYMVDACGNTFHRFQAAADSLSITDVLLCSGVSLPGPGVIYKLNFAASTTPQVTYVRFRQVQFFEGGLYVTPLFASDAAIGIGVTVAVDPTGPGPSSLALRASPNPFHGRTSIRIISPVEGTQRIVIRDIQGRQVRDFGQGWFGAGSRQVQWDGHDDAGRRLPAGVYRITLQSGSTNVSTLAALLR